MHVLPFESQVRVIGALTEGCSIRSVERMTKIHRDTVMRLGSKIGQACEQLHDSLMCDLQVSTIELDEQWDFISKKQKHVTFNDPKEKGDVWLFVALSANHKAVLSYVVGKRTADNARILAQDLRSRILNRPQITSDGYLPYIQAVKLAFSTDADFAQLVKVYQAEPGNDSAHRYSPGRIRSIEKAVIQGVPDPDKISTSYVERFNLSTRMSMRRFTRLTNGFSKKLENHKAAVSLWICFYNLCRVHETLRCTPAMALGVTNHVWSIAELVDNALNITTSEHPMLLQ
ncbi:MAG TPA: IS1 family transposase [Candidatus Binataceae bacterium]|nr:IS1 family transposase [Candidatus Binataceae bacterium]